MTPHISGTSLDAQIRYATGAHYIVKRYLAGESQEQVNLIVENGEVSTDFLDPYTALSWRTRVNLANTATALVMRKIESTTLTCLVC